MPARSLRPLIAELLTSKGRVSTDFFWASHLAFWGIAMVLGFISKQLPESAKVFIGLLAAPLVFMLMIVQVKRWHDRDKSGWWVLINYVPCIGMIWTLIECGFLPGTQGPNRFGADPKAKPIVK